MTKVFAFQSKNDIDRRNPVAYPPRLVLYMSHVILQRGMKNKGSANLQLY